MMIITDLRPITGFPIGQRFVIIINKESTTI